MPPSPRIAWSPPIRIASFLAFTLIMISWTVRGVEGQTPQAEAESAGDRAVQRATESEQLSKRNYSGRQQATLEMWRRRDLSREEVQRAARDPDPEVSGRAKWILRQWRRGSLPDTPPEISRLLQRSDDPSAIQELLEGGQFVAAVVAVEESAGTVDRESIQKRVNTAIRRRFPVYIKAALENDSLSDLLKLIDLTADSKEMAVCRIQLMQQLGMAIDASNLLPTSSETWTQDQRHRATVMVLTILGRLDEAMEVASDSGDEILLRVCQMLAGRWSEMAIESAKLAKTAESGSYEHARLWCQALIAADRCEDRAVFAQAVEQLSTVETTDSELAIELRWKCLAGHGQVDAALAILDKARPDASAVVAIASSRGHRAFDALGFPLDRIDQDIEQWIDDAIDSQRGASELTEDVRNVLALMRCLLSIGREDAAWTIANRMCDCGVDVGTIPLREYVLSTLTMTSRRDWVLRLAGIAGEELFSATTQSTLARTLPDADALSFELLMKAIPVLMPREPFDVRLRAVYQLLAGETADGLDSDVDLKRLYDYLSSKREIRQFAGRVVLSPRLSLNIAIADMFSMQGRADLATKCLQMLVANGDVEAAFQMAESELDGGRAETASDLFERVWSLIEEQGSETRFRGLGDDAGLAAKALVGQWTIAKRGGDIQRGEDLLRQLRLTLCSPSTDLRDSLASHLGDRGELDLALQAYQSLLPMTAFGTSESTGLYQVAWRYSRLAREVDVSEAARWYDLAAGGTLESTDYRSVAYITLPLDVRRWLLEAAIKRNDVDAARRHIQRILQLDPLDIDSAERLLPLMRTAGMETLADQTFTKIIDRGIVHAKDFPFDSTSCNNLAWVAAMNEQRLDVALELSELACYVEPDSAIFRDTLAEVLFQLGRKTEALQVEQSCLLDDPSQWHLHQQIKKYRQAINDES